MKELVLPTVRVDRLAKVSLLIQQADADDRYAEVARGLEVVAGEDPEPGLVPPPQEVIDRLIAVVGAVALIGATAAAAPSATLGYDDARHLLARPHGHAGGEQLRAVCAQQVLVEEGQPRQVGRARLSLHQG